MTATWWRPGTAKSVLLDPIVTDICRALVILAVRGLPSYVAFTEETELVPKKPPLMLKLVAPDVPCGIVSGEGPEITGRTAPTTTEHWATTVQLCCGPACSETVIARVPGEVNRLSGM